MSTAMLNKAVQVGGEAAIGLLFQSAAMAEQHRLDLNFAFNPKVDRLVAEMRLRFGRADFVIFHADGSATVIEVKDGSNGYNHVVAGIGQASLYAAQLLRMRGAVNNVRKVLLWTSTGSADMDWAIECACYESNTIPDQWGPLAAHLAATRRVLHEAVQ